VGVRDEVLRMLKEDHLSPGEIAVRRNVTVSTILGYLDQMVGAGRLRRSDILFTVPSEKRSLICRAFRVGQSAHQCWAALRKLPGGADVCEDDVTVVLRYGSAGHSLGDIYEDVRTIEVELHKSIREALEREFGPDESGWWRRGIPVAIRKTCQERREDDAAPAPEPYCYTDLLDLKAALDKQWRILQRYLPPKVVKDKPALLADLVELNRIRRMVMHPVRGAIPSEADFDFLRSLKIRLSFS